MDTRMKTILHELMAADHPVTSTYLAGLNHVTVRTTRDDIKKLNSILAVHGAEIASKPSKGYKLDILDRQLFLQYLQTITIENVRGNLIPDTPEERLGYIIRRLLLSNHYIVMDDLADELFVSKSTIQGDMKIVKEILKKYDIQLESRPNHGLRAAGSEMKLRFCLSEYLFDRKELKPSPLIETPFLTITNQDLDHIQKIILRLIQKHRISMSDIAIHNLLVHIAIAYKRIVSGNYVSLYKNHLKEIEQQVEYSIAKEMAEEVEKIYRVAFPEEEIAYIAMHLLGTKLLEQTKSDLVSILEEDIFQLVNHALIKVEEQMQLGIRQDEELIFSMAMHLKPAINRIKYGMNIRNPLLEDIKKNYPLAYEAGVIASLAIKELTGIEIDENEIGYLALHIGAAIERKKLLSGPKRCLVVCASGLGTAKLIYYRLKSYFGSNLEVVGTTEYYNLHQMERKNIDFIVSSIPIPETLDVPVIEVNAVLSEQDLKSIETFLLNRGNERMFLSYFHKDRSFFQKRFDTKDQVLEFLNHKLLERGLVGSDFLDAVYEREKIAPTDYGNLVAIPHPVSPKTTETFVGICTLEKAIIWNEKPVQIIFLLCVKKNSQEDLQDIYDLLGEIIESKHLVQKILKAKTFEEFVAIIDNDNEF